MTAPRALSKVLFPEPDGPIKPTTSPGATRILTSLRASTAVEPLPYRLQIFSISIPPPISATDRLGGVDLQRHPDRDDAGERTYGDDSDNADDRIGGKKKDEFR